jgi:hypothetical protein
MHVNLERNGQKQEINLCAHISSTRWSVVTDNSLAGRTDESGLDRLTLLVYSRIDLERSEL